MRMTKHTATTRKNTRTVQKLVSVSEFIQDETGKAVGIKGLSYPDKSSVEVTLTTSGPNAENPKRRDFEAYRKGFKAPNGVKLAIEPGAVLRLNCRETEGGKLEAEWINVLAGNKEATKALRFGYTAVELYTPEPIKEKYREVAAALKAENPDATRNDIEDALLEAIKGERRYNGNALLYHHRDIMDTDRESLRDTLADYYGSKKFAKIPNEDGTKEYAPVSPGVVIRSLDAEGDVLAAVDVTGAMLYNAKAELPEERAAYAASLAERIGEGATSFSLLPYDRIRVSEYSLTVEEKNIPGIKAFARAQRMSFQKVMEGEEAGYENRAFQAVVKSAGNGMISEVAAPSGAKVADIALLARDGSEMKAARRQEEEETEGTSPGM